MTRARNGLLVQRAPKFAVGMEDVPAMKANAPVHQQVAPSLPLSDALTQPTVSPSKKTAKARRLPGKSWPVCVRASQMRRHPAGSKATARALKTSARKRSIQLVRTPSTPTRSGQQPKSSKMTPATSRAAHPSTQSSARVASASSTLDTARPCPIRLVSFRLVSIFLRLPAVAFRFHAETAAA